VVNAQTEEQRNDARTRAEERAGEDLLFGHGELASKKDRAYNGKEE